MSGAPFTLGEVPHRPGCYLYKDVTGKIIYIGKANDLRKRVSQYFTKDHPDRKTRLLVRAIADVDFFITSSEHEALVLEANLIKKHKPKFNIDLKHGNRYAYILLTREKFPRLLTARDTSDKGLYFGPFTSGFARQTLLRTLRKAFFIRTCRTFPKKPCLRYHIGLCKAPCVGLQSEEEYCRNVDEVVAFLKGGSPTIISRLEVEMKSLAQNQAFELAKEKREQILALESLQQRQDVQRADESSMDAINFIKNGDKVELFVFSVRNGMLGDKDEFTLEFSDGFLDEFLRRYYEQKGSSIPRTILVPETVDVSLAQYFSVKANHKVDIVVPQRGKKKSLLELVRKNVEVIKSAPSKASEGLQLALDLPVAPRVIETFDISHLSGTDTVAAMVQFVDGKPNKSGYRRFKIRSVEGEVDDFRSMREVVARRYKRLVDEQAQLPDLVVIDGGGVQLAFALQALDEVGVQLPIVGLAKREEELYLPNKRSPLRLPKSSEMMNLLIAGRDEAHRFSLQYQRLLRSKRAKK